MTQQRLSAILTMHGIDHERTPDGCIRAADDGTINGILDRQYIDMIPAEWTTGRLLLWLGY